MELIFDDAVAYINTVGFEVLPGTSGSFSFEGKYNIKLFFYIFTSF
jgi:hypothetical protein